MSSAAPQRMVELDVIRQLHDDVGGDVSITCGVLRSYEQRAPELVTVLDRAAAAGESEGVRQAAHDLRSISGFVGAVSIQALAAELETQHPMSAERMTELVTRLGEQLPAVLAELGRFAEEL